MNKQLEDDEDIEKMIASGNVVTNDELRDWLQGNNELVFHGNMYNKGCFNIPSCSAYDKNVLSFNITHDIKYDNNNNEYISKNIVVMQRIMKKGKGTIIDDIDNQSEVEIREIARGSVDNLGDLINLELEYNEIKAIKQEYSKQGYLDIDVKYIERTWGMPAYYIQGKTYLEFSEFSTDNIDIDLELVKLVDDEIYAFYDYVVANLPDMYKKSKHINYRSINPIEQILDIDGARHSLSFIIDDNCKSSFSQGLYLDILRDEIVDIMEYNTDSLYEKALDDLKTYGIPKNTRLILNEYIKDEITEDNKIVNDNLWNTKEVNNIDYER